MAEAPRIWLTRPAEDSASLAAELARHGIPSLIAPVMRVVHLPAQTDYSAATAPAALLLSSRHAAPALATLPAEWRMLPAYCVGESTAKAASAHGYKNVIAGTADLMHLLPRLSSELPAGSHLLYLAGEETRLDVAALLAAQEIHVQTETVYRAIAITQLEPALQQALTPPVSLRAVAFFSPRSAAIACDLLQHAALTEAASTIEAFCLSMNVAAAAAKLPWARLHACHHPTRSAMVDLVVSELIKRV